jgi:hypothetical protein
MISGAFTGICQAVRPFPAFEFDQMKKVPSNSLLATSDSMELVYAVGRRRRRSQL